MIFQTWAERSSSPTPDLRKASLPPVFCPDLLRAKHESRPLPYARKCK